MTKKLPAYQAESFQSRVHGLGYNQIQGISSSKKDMDDALMNRRYTQNAYRNSNEQFIVNKKIKNITGSLGSLKGGHMLASADSSSPDIDFMQKKGMSLTNVDRRQHIGFDSENDYQVYNASGANGRSQFIQSPGIPTFKKGGEGSLPFIRKLDPQDKEKMKKINEESTNDLTKAFQLQKDMPSLVNRQQKVVFSSQETPQNNIHKRGGSDVPHSQKEVMYSKHKRNEQNLNLKTISDLEDVTADKVNLKQSKSSMTKNGSAAKKAIQTSHPNCGKV